MQICMLLINGIFESIIIETGKRGNQCVWPDHDDVNNCDFNKLRMLEHYSKKIKISQG